MVIQLVPLCDGSVVSPLWDENSLAPIAIGVSGVAGFVCVGDSQVAEEVVSEYLKHLHYLHILTVAHTLVGLEESPVDRQQIPIQINGWRDDNLLSGEIMKHSFIGLLSKFLCSGMIPKGGLLRCWIARVLSHIYSHLYPVHISPFLT